MSLARCNDIFPKCRYILYANLNNKRIIFFFHPNALEMISANSVWIYIYMLVTLCVCQVTYIMLWYGENFRPISCCYTIHKAIKILVQRLKTILPQYSQIRDSIFQSMVRYGLLIWFRHQAPKAPSVSPSKSTLRKRWTP